MASITGGAPKELLKVGGQTVLGRIVAEARSAGADRVIVVSSPDKPQLDEACKELGVEVATQQEMRGVADAISCARVTSDALIMMGDSIYHGGSPSARMVELIAKGIPGCIAVEQVTEAEMSLYGIVEVNPGTGQITRILEKPKPDQTLSRWAVSARYALSASLMNDLNTYAQDPEIRATKGEIGLTAMLNQAIELGADIKAVALQPTQARVDCGSPEEYDKARRMDWR